MTENVQCHSPIALLTSVSVCTIRWIPMMDDVVMILLMQNRDRLTDSLMIKREALKVKERMSN